MEKAEANLSTLSLRSPGVGLKNVLSQNDELCNKKPMSGDSKEKAEDSMHLEKNKSFASGADKSENFTSDFDSDNSDSEHEFEEDGENEPGKDASAAPSDDEKNPPAENQNVSASAFVPLTNKGELSNKVDQEVQEMKDQEELSSHKPEIVKPVQFDFDSEMSEPMTDLEDEEEESVEELSEMKPIPKMVNVNTDLTQGSPNASVSLFAKTTIEPSKINNEENSSSNTDFKVSKAMEESNKSNPIVKPSKLSLEEYSSPLKVSDASYLNLKLITNPLFVN